jgi:primosomal protein N' (replication factor Y)
MYAEILLTQKVGKDKDTLTYKVPAALAQRLEPGSVVEIPLRNRKIRGVVAKFHDHEPVYQTKEILDLVEKAPHLRPWQIELLNWISDRYFCPPYKVLKQFFPDIINKKKNLIEWIPHEEELESHKNLTLTEEQENAVQATLTTEKRTILLHGITGSGKTEIYRRIAENILQKGQQILILVPEITLTPQTLQNFQQEFGNNIAILHSQLTAKQKENYWYRIFHGETNIIIGSRSALFAPFKNLGAIIMDEEHEPSYKQDQAPRYHARNVALQIGRILNIKVVLGSATPSIESYHEAKQGNYELIELTKRIQHQAETTTLPKITVVDLRDELKKKNYSIFSETLSKKLHDKFTQKEQSILFLNRRGSASAVLCRECGHIERCEHCDVAFTYHKQLSIEELNLPAERLICHHCGIIKKVPVTCPNCDSHFIRYIGLGTQKIQETVLHDFPTARVLRADRDTIRHRDDFAKIYNAFKNHEADILIGTQMIGKGLHLPQVNLVGVVLADLSLAIPDFRSTERTFQILTQVAGRAGRQGSKGEVVIQTYLPDNYAIQATAKNDYAGFFEAELKIRKSFNYPPFSKIIKITVVNAKAEKALQKAKELFKQLNSENASPELQNLFTGITLYPAFIHKLQNKYRWNILLTGQQPSLLLKRVQKQDAEFFNDPMIRVDVDPLSSS